MKSLSYTRKKVFVQIKIGTRGKYFCQRRHKNIKNDKSHDPILFYLRNSLYEDYLKNLWSLRTRDRASNKKEKERIKSMQLLKYCINWVINSFLKTQLHSDFSQI